MFKTVVALVLGIAIRDGNVESVDQPVSDYLTRWKADERGSIRFRNLLEMTGGLDHPLAGTPSAAALETSDDRVAAAMALPLVRTPGAVFDYSTATTTLLMEAIGQAVQRPFADYLSQVLWAPLGAGDAWLAGDKAGHATPSLLATAQDWMRVGLLIQQRGAWRGPPAGARGLDRPDDDAVRCEPQLRVAGLARLASRTSPVLRPEGGAHRPAFGSIQGG